MGESFRIAALDAYCEGTASSLASLLVEVRMFDVLRGLDWALRNPDAREVDDAVSKVAEALTDYG